MSLVRCTNSLKGFDAKISARKPSLFVWTVVGGVMLLFLWGCAQSRENDPLQIRQKIITKVEELATVELEKMNVQEKMYATQLRNEVERYHPFNPTYYFKKYKEYKSWQLLDVREEPYSLLTPYYANVGFTYDQYETEHIYDFSEGTALEKAEKDNKFKLTLSDQAETLTYWFDYDGTLKESAGVAQPMQIAAAPSSQPQVEIQKINVPIGIVPSFEGATPAPKATLPPPPEVRTSAAVTAPPMLDAAASAPPAMKPAGEGPVSPVSPDAINFMKQRGINFVAPQATDQ